jgi:CubicO group peptidase (beta-lactamase class C family)
MRRAFIILVTAAIVLLHGPAGAEDLVFTRFGDYLEALRAQTGIPGLGAAIVGKNDVLWDRAFGMQDVERSMAMRPDTPIHIDGLTEAISVTLVLQCVEEGRITLDDPIGRFRPDAADPGLTVRQVLTHTAGSPENPIYSYRPDRLQPLMVAVRACTGDSYRETLANLFDRLAMTSSVPGPDVLTLVPPAEGVLTSEFERYSSVFARMATPYAVDGSLRQSVSAYSATTLTPSSGIISTVRDLEQFDLAFKNGVLLRSDTLGMAWRTPATASGARLPHGMGWFVQTYNGEPVVWQFGASDNGSSSMMVVLPARSLTLILVANSTGLVKSFGLPAGDVSASPFGRLFLQTFVR